MSSLGLPPWLDWPVQFCIFTSAATWIASVVTANVSQVDRLWTFLPTIYTAYFALLPLWPTSQPFYLAPYSPKALGWATVRDFSPRAVLMLVLIVIWMFRLSYNTWRRGLFDLKDEDYRWAVLRRQLPPWLFQITNFFFISIIQNILLLLLGIPTYIAAVVQPHTPLATSDYVLAGVALTILAFEFTADNQQFAFHAYKHAHLAQERGEKSAPKYNPADHWPGARLSWTPDDAKRGFVTRGLWRYSRHPNFACEQSFWWTITLMPLLSPSPPNLPQQSEIPPLRTVLVALFNPSLHEPLLASLKATFGPALLHLLPAIALSALFFSSTAYTEAITKSKYGNKYDAYQKRVGMFEPAATALKWFKVNYLSSDSEKQTVQRLVWGNSHTKSE